MIYTSDRGVASAQHVFGTLVQLVAPHITAYHSDLYYDALTLAEYAEPGATFYLSVNTDGQGTHLWRGYVPREKRYYVTKGDAVQTLGRATELPYLWHIVIGPEFNQNNRDFTFTEVPTA